MDLICPAAVLVEEMAASAQQLANPSAVPVQAMWGAILYIDLVKLPD